MSSSLLNYCYNAFVNTYGKAPNATELVQRYGIDYNTASQYIRNKTSNESKNNNNDNNKYIKPKKMKSKGKKANIFEQKSNDVTTDNKIVLKKRSLKSKYKTFKGLKKMTKQTKEMLITGIDRRKKFPNGLTLTLKDKAKIDITKIIVKLIVYYDELPQGTNGGVGTGNIITVKDNKIYVLTCAHNVTTYDKWNKKWVNASDISFIHNNILWRY